MRTTPITSQKTCHQGERRPDDCEQLVDSGEQLVFRPSVHTLLAGCPHVIHKIITSDAELAFLNHWMIYGRKTELRGFQSYLLASARGKLSLMGELAIEAALAGKRRDTWTSFLEQLGRYARMPSEVKESTRGPKENAPRHD